jgi:Cys-tRNA synthase (O-phospho-L-seryl-tRNA:Cys-tRNA synthase)
MKATNKITVPRSSKRAKKLQKIFSKKTLVQSPKPQDKIKVHKEAPKFTEISKKETKKRII